MRIAFVNNFFLPRLSGSAHLTAGLASGLAAKGHDVLVLTAAQGRSPGEEVHDGYRVVRLACRELPETKLAMRYDVNFVASPHNVRRVFQVLDDFDPQVVHQHGQFFDLTWISAIWCRRRRVPAVLTVHTPLIHTSTPHAAALWLGDMALVRPFLAIGHPTIVVVDSFMRDYVRRRYHPKDDRIRNLLLGVDLDRFEDLDQEAAKRQLGLADRRVVLSIGHVIPLRNRLPLIEALPYLVKEQPEVSVVVVGNVLDEHFLVRAEELGVNEHIVVTGAVPRDQVPLYVAAADVECHDLQGYGLGTSTLEVMASGVPVVAVVQPDNFPGLQLRNWENIVMAQPDDPIGLAESLDRVLGDPELARAVGEGERQLIRRHFSMDAVTDEHVELYRELAERRVALA